MKRKILLTGVMVATMITISACGGKTVEETTAVETETTTMAETSTEETTVEETTLEETEADAKAPASEFSKMTAEDIRSFAEEVQITVEENDIENLAGMSEYPLYIRFEDGTDLVVQEYDELVDLGEDKIFTEKLIKAIEAIDLEELKEVEAGVVMGDEVNITFNEVDGAPAVTGINL